MQRPEGNEVFPAQFGRYTLTQRLATGGMAEVFKAKIQSTHGFEKLLVIKRILPQLAADRTFVSMFVDEAKLTAQLVHPKIVQVSDFGEVGGQFFIALEFVDGFDALALLRASAQRQVRIPIPISLFIVIEVLDALDYAHNARDVDGSPMHLVHRDISPSNIFLSRRGDIKLGDFGIAHAQARESKTQAGTLKGKFGYMSPEQVLGARLDARSDLFSVSIVLAEMIMGRRLFTAPNDLDVLLMVRDGRLDRLDKYCRDLPPELDQLLRKGLEHKASQRFQTAAEFRDALSDLLFKLHLRIGPADVGRIASDYFDPAPEALLRLREQVKRLRIRAPTAVYPSVTDAMTPPPQAISQVASQRQEWGMSGTPPPRSSASAAPAPRPSPSPPPRAEIEMRRDVEAPSLSLADADGPEKPMHTTALSPPRTSEDSQVLAAIDQALSQPLAIVDLDEYEAPAPEKAAPRAAPSGGLSLVQAERPDPPPARAPLPSPNDSGDLSVLSPLRVFADLAVSRATGLLRFQNDPVTKDVYVVNGAPDSLVSNQAADRFADYLVALGLVRPTDLPRAAPHDPRFGSKRSGALLSPSLSATELRRLQSRHLREKVSELYAWTSGTFGFYRGQRDPAAASPLELDGFEILGGGVLTLSLELLQRRFLLMADFHPRASPHPRISFEAFRLGSKPQEISSLLDGRRTIRQLMTRYGSTSDALTFMRVLYLLLETDLAWLE